MRFQILLYLAGISCLAGVCCHMDGDQERMLSLVDQLEQQPLGPVELGTPVPMRTDVTEAIVNEGRAFIPALGNALVSDSAVKAGYAAYCLQRIGDCSQSHLAAVALDGFQSKRSTPEVRFAVWALDEYLNSCKDK